MASLVGTGLSDPLHRLGHRFTTQKTHVATVLGVALTLACVAGGWEAAQIDLLFFVATGLPQIIRRESRT